MRSGIMPNGKKDREHTQWEIHSQLPHPIEGGACD